MDLLLELAGCTSNFVCVRDTRKISVSFKVTQTSLSITTYESKKTIHLIKEKFGLNMSMGASNVSFGLPNRHAVNASFLPMAMAAGLTSAIMDARTNEIVTSVRAADLLIGNDPWGGNWISAFRAQQASA
jgi:cobalamin-dependent methionine synthase I